MNKELDSKAGKNFKAGMDVASTSLKAFDKLVPGVLGTVANVVDQISAAQATIRGLSSGLMQWGTGIGAALGIVATIAGAVINNIREAEESAGRHLRKEWKAIKNTEMPSGSWKPILMY